MKTVIAGSRGITDIEILKKAINFLPWRITSIISGGAAGVDSLAEYYAIAAALPLTVMKADWEKNGKAAGFIRNRAMVREAEASLCIWDGYSSGTKNTINLSKSKGIPTFVYTVLNGGEFNCEYFNGER